ncbi:MAG: DUF4253 domain-containing protein [Lachnospiraceae bacterium]|nr:DUF4253 domain-containing protein [Lachnospiraceae bacterium]
MRDEMKKILKQFQCEYSIFEKGSNPEKLEAAYLETLQDGAGKAYYPAILVVDEYVTEWLDYTFEENGNRDELIQACSDRGKELLQERFRDYMEDYEEDYEQGMEEFIGNETEGEVLHHFSAYTSFDEYVLAEDTLLLKIPVQHPWEIIAWIPMGGWNECPAPEEMMSICKYWYEAYGAIPAVFTHDEMEFYAPKKLNGADSLEVAKEHYAFCVDRVDQGTRTYTLSELAVGLQDSDMWYFWWD